MSSSEARAGGALPRLSVALSVVTVLMVAGVVGPAPVPLGFVVLGGLVVAAGVLRRQEHWTAVGASGLFAGVVVAGQAGRSPAWVLAATVPVMLAWLHARYAIRLGRQVGREGATRRVELVHMITTTTVLIVGGGIAYLVSRVMRGGSPLVLGLLLGAAVAFTLALR